MGHLLHHAIIVIADEHEAWILDARTKARKLGLQPTKIKRARVNGVRSFMVPPDGSKEGWADSDRGDELREEFVEWLESRRYEDGSTPLKWVQIAIGDDDEDETTIVSKWRNTGEAAGE